MKPIIIHHHIFKNSGTSFDQILIDNYGKDAFFEDNKFPFFRYTSFQIEKIVQSIKSFRSISSHQFPHPFSNKYKFIKNRDVYSVTFLRDPITRVKSIYSFKRKNRDSSISSRNARKYNFKDWLEISMEDDFERLHVSNSQCSFFSIDDNGKAIKKRDGYCYLYDLDLAKKNLRKFFFCGITEEFEHSVARLNNQLSKNEVDVLKFGNVRKNVTSSNLDEPINIRIEKVLDELGKSLGKKLLEMNNQDFMLRDYAKELFFDDKN